MIYPTKKEFLALTKKGNLIPVYKEILGDLETPVSAYYKLAAKTKFSFLLESVEGEEKIARYSFLASEPELVLKTKGLQASILRRKGRKFTKENISFNNNPLNLIRDIMSQYQFVPVKGLPRFCGGMVGFMSYDTVRFFERLPQKTEDDLKLPDNLFILAKNILIFDHLSHKIKIVKCVDIPGNSTRADKMKIYDQAQAYFNDMRLILKKPLRMNKRDKKVTDKKKISLRVTSNFDEKEFKHIVQKAKKEIRAGEIIQVVLSQRFEVSLHTDPFNIYRMLRALNPSPYMYYLNYDDIQIIGSSPELLVRCENGIVETRPIAGTRPRGRDDKHDQELAEDLLQDPKERAEHIMLVDLGRNDLGRVSEAGSVKLTEFMKIEKYSHVMHIVSNVQGHLKKSYDDFDVLQSAFPAGTVSGAPKIRAMEIIDDLEKTARGPYAGCIGYFSFSGNLDTCITIRTIVAHKGKAYVQAGAGIVADSKPQKEYQETVSKAKSQILAIEMAHRTDY
ncbi:MAG: anthranilate synthase component I [Candidatus Omnitrophica bacterium]|nr:anthranilate synthase component I [Candidatus Omnitrophota bacterium]